MVKYLANITLTSVINGLFHTRYLHSFFFVVTLGVKLDVELTRGSPQPVLIL